MGCTCSVLGEVQMWRDGVQRHMPDGSDMSIFVYVSICLAIHLFLYLFAAVLNMSSLNPDRTNGIRGAISLTAISQCVFLHIEIVKQGLRCVFIYKYHPNLTKLA